MVGRTLVGKTEEAGVGIAGLGDSSCVFKLARERLERKLAWEGLGLGCTCEDGPEIRRSANAVRGTSEAGENENVTSPFTGMPSDDTRRSSVMRPFRSRVKEIDELHFEGCRTLSTQCMVDSIAACHVYHSK